MKSLHMREHMRETGAFLKYWSILGYFKGRDVKCYLKRKTKCLSFMMTANTLLFLRENISYQLSFILQARTMKYSFSAEQSMQNWKRAFSWLLLPVKTDYLVFSTDQLLGTPITFRSSCCHDSVTGRSEQKWSHTGEKGKSWKLLIQQKRCPRDEQGAIVELKTRELCLSLPTVSE